MSSKNTISEIQISYRPETDPSAQPQVNRAFQAYQIFRDSWDHQKIGYIEQFKALLLNKANRVLGIVEVSSGGVSSTVVDPKVIFGAAIKANASGIILCHNHPSGSLRPSEHDLRTTKNLCEGAKLFEMVILDHLIIGKSTFYSMADDGLI